MKRRIATGPLKSALLLLIGLCGVVPVLGLETALNFRVLAIHPERPQPGELFQITILVESGVGSVRARILALAASPVGEFKGFELLRMQGKSIWLVSAVLPLLASAREYILSIDIPGADKPSISWPLLLSPRTFMSETIGFTKTLSDLKTVPDPRKAAESRELQAILRRFDTSLKIATGNLQYPLATLRKTSYFGDRRVYKYDSGSTETTTHNGLDLGGNQAEVYAPYPGTIVFAKSRIVTGNTIVIQHQPGLYSLFYHLSEISAVVGSFVESGTMLAKTGSTGLATGPHLHWEVRCEGEAVDPEALIANGLVDTSTLKQVLSASLFP